MSDLSPERREELARALYDAEGFHAADAWEADTSINQGRCEGLAEGIAPLIAGWLDLTELLATEGSYAEGHESGVADVRARVERLHQRQPADSPFNSEGRDVCSTCMDGIHAADWPCATLAALNGGE